MHPNGCFFVCYFQFWHCVWLQHPQENSIGSLETNTTYNNFVIQSLSAYNRGFCWTGALCPLYKLLGNGHLYKHSWKFSHMNEARHYLLDSVIDGYVIFHHRSRLISTCNVCSKPSRSCTHGSTLLIAPLRWGWEYDETGDWIPLWTTPPGVNAVCMGLTKCNCMGTVPVTVAATKPH